MSSFLIELHTGEDRGVETYAEDAHKLADTLLTLTSDPVQMQAMTGHNECDLDLEVSVSNGELVAYAVMDFMEEGSQVVITRNPNPKSTSGKPLRVS